jgi:hypothetical protein
VANTEAVTDFDLGPLQVAVQHVFEDTCPLMIQNLCEGLLEVPWVGVDVVAGAGDD